MSALLCVQVKGFRSYVDLYLKDKVDETGNALKVIHEEVNSRWEVCLTLSEKGFQQVSFVNSIATTKVTPLVKLVPYSSTLIFLAICKCTYISEKYFNVAKNVLKVLNRYLQFCGFSWPQSQVFVPFSSGWQTR